MTSTQRVLVAVVVTVGGLVLVGLSAIAALSWFFSGTNFGSTFATSNFDTIEDWEAAAGFEESLGLDFPPSTSNIRVASDGFQEPLYQIRFTIDGEELPILEESIGCDGLLSQEASRPPEAVITEEIEWWQPGEATTYRACSGGEAPGRVLRVFVDQSAATTNDVYVLAIYL
jgi:hypothetical protein